MNSQPNSEATDAQGEHSPKRRMGAYARLIRLNRPIGILLLLWPALWALWIAANGEPRWDVVVIFVLGVGLMRSAGCAINDYADRHIDGHVERTKMRPLATGEVSPGEALWVFVVLSLCAFGLVLLLDWNTIMMSVVALFLASLYPFMKRYTHLPQLVLGMAFGWAIPMAYMALTGEVPLVAWVLYLAAVIWALIYDTEYAMVDREDDLKIGVKSTAILFDRKDRLIIGVLQALMVLLLVVVGVLSGLGAYYYLGVTVAGILFAWQQHLIAEREQAACFKAFLNNNYLGMAVFVGLLVDFMV